MNVSLSTEEIILVSLLESSFKGVFMESDHMSATWFPSDQGMIIGSRSLRKGNHLLGK